MAAAGSPTRRPSGSIKSTWGRSIHSMLIDSPVNPEMINHQYALSLSLRSPNGSSDVLIEDGRGQWGEHDAVSSYRLVPGLTSK